MYDNDFFYADYGFFYADIEGSLALLNNYKLDDWINARNKVAATCLRGGLLSGCNIRFSFKTSLEYLRHTDDEDYKGQGLFVFQPGLNYRVLDKYQIGGKAQILMSPINEMHLYDLEDIVSSARADFRALYNMKPVKILDNTTWKGTVAIIPGKNGQDNPLKGFQMDF
jgi:hypothetical protein